MMQDGRLTTLDEVLQGQLRERKDRGQDSPRGCPARTETSNARAQAEQRVRRHRCGLGVCLIHVLETQSLKSYVNVLGGLLQVVRS